jgi:hypothetical protein
LQVKATYRPPERTPLPFAVVVDAMRWALKWVLGVDPSDEVLALALAKCALETGRWLQIWLNNWGNVKAGPDYVGNFTCITLNELLNGKLVWFAPEGQLSASPAKGGKLIGPPIAVPDGHPQTRMRAYANAYDGALSYVQFVSGGYYRAAWAQLLRGDAAAYVHALKMAKYFTADEGPYRAGVVSLQREMLARLRSEAPPPAVDLEWARLKELVPQLQFDVADLLETSAGQDFPEVVA